MSRSVKGIPNADLLYKEVEYRRKKQWDIFSWCSTLLVAITGGVIALQKPASPLLLGQKVSISSAVLVLATNAAIWIGHNNYLERSIKKNCFDQEFNKTVFGPHKYLATTYLLTIFMLAIAALWATWYSQPSAPSLR